MISKTPLLKLKTILDFFSLDKFRIRQVPRDLNLTAFQSIFNDRINSYLDIKLESYRKYSDSKITLEAIEYAVSLIRAGGKRVRPYLAFVTFVNEGGTNQEEVIRAGIALELFHVFALIHDDLIDKGTERHGKLTTHVHLKKYIEAFPRGDKSHIAAGMSMLAGDLILSWAHEVIAHLNNHKVQEIFFRMIEEVVAGQLLDMSFMLQYEVETKTILKKNELKTALYSFVNPMLIGNALTYKVGHEDLYTKMGLALGQAYQIQDDLLDVIGSRKNTGKVNLLDVQDGQHTILSQYIFENSEPYDREVFMSLFGKTVDDHSKKVLMRLFKDSGAIEYAEAEVLRLFDMAKKMVSESDMKASSKKTWNVLIDFLDKRKS